MRKSHTAPTLGLIAAVVALTALTGCDTNYYGDSGRTTTTTTTAAPPPPAATSTTTVQPNPDGSVTTTEHSYRRY